MLIEKSKIKVIKFVSGEEIIARYNDIEKTVTFPMLFVISDIKTQAHISFMPWGIGMDLSSEIKINPAAIIAVSNPNQDANSKYQEVLGSLGVI